MGRLAGLAREGKPPRIREARLSTAERVRLQVAVYEGSPDHKQNAAAFGLTSRSGPRPDATKCEAAGVTTADRARELFRCALEAGMVSEQFDRGFPKRLWVVDGDDRVYEIRHGGSRDGAYHGFPIQRDNPISEQIRIAWGRR